jgi:hypothetical protein
MIDRINSLINYKNTFAMKQLSFFTALLILSVTVSAQVFESAKQVFESPKLKTEIAKHKLIAILPYKATISYKRTPKNFDAAANRQEEQNLATSMQEGMYTYLLRKSGDYSVSFQDVSRTNALLKQADVYDRIDVLTQDSIARILGVDAVIYCTYKYEKTGSEGGAIAKTILLGAGTGKVASGGLTLQLYNGTDGDLLWRFYKEMNEDVLSSANQVMERMMRKVGRNFPYEK